MTSDPEALREALRQHQNQPPLGVGPADNLFAPDSEIEAVALVELLRAAGADVTTDRLGVWRRDGLIPPSRTKGLGRGQGTQTLFPLSAVAQAKAAAGFLDSGMTKLEAGFMLWWAGFDVSEKYWRPRLTGAAAEWDQVRAALRPVFSPGLNSTDAEDDARTGEMDHWLQEVITRDDVPTPLKRIRKPLGPRRSKAFFQIFARILAGRFEGLSTKQGLYDEDRVQDTQCLDVGLGLANARQNYPVGGTPWLTGSIEETFVELSKAMATGSVQGTLAETPLADLHHARDQLRRCGDILDAFVTATIGGWGADAFGFKRLLDRFAFQSPKWLASILVGWLKLGPVFQNRLDKWIDSNESALLAKDLAKMSAPIAKPLNFKTSSLVFPYGNPEDR